mgnify:FL=1
MAATPNTLSTSEYWMSPDALTIDLNALDNPQYLQVSLLAGSVITAYRQGVIDYDASLNYRKWTLQAYNNFFDRTDRAYVYAQLEKEGNTALIIYSYDILELTGTVTDSSGNSFDVYNIFLATISPSVNISGESIMRTWETAFDTGSLNTDKNRNEEQLGEWAKMFRLNKVTDMIEVLKDITEAVIHRLKIGARKILITDVFTSSEEDISRRTDDQSVPTTKFLQDFTEGRFLSKISEDETKFLLKLLGGVITPRIQSQSFTPGAVGNGYTVQMNENGQSYIEVDKLLVRMQAIFQKLSIAETDIAGSTIVLNSGPRITCTKVEVYDSSELYFVDDAEAYFSDGNRVYVDGFIRCYFLNDDGEKTVENSFKVGDFVRSQTFNIKAGVYENVSNHYYWRKVIGVGDDYIDLAAQDCDEGSDLPKEGDAIVQFGNETDPDRQNIIVFSAYGEGAPYITFYKGIDSYSLNGKDQFSVGYDSVTQQCYLRNYGRAYIGLRNESSYLRVEPLMNKMFFKGDVEITGGFNDEIAKYIGYTGGWSEMVDQAIKGRTFIKGGYINAELLDVKTVITSELIADAIKSNELNVNDKFIVSPYGELTAEGADIKGVISAESGEFNNGVFKNCTAENFTAQGTFKTSNESDQIIIDSNSNSIIFKSGNIQLAEMFFYDNLGYKTARLNLISNGGAIMNIAPGEIYLFDKRPVLPIGSANSIELKMDYNGLYIKNFSSNDSIYIGESSLAFQSSGNTYTGITDTFSIQIDEGYYKKIFFKNGIAYKIE